MASSSTPHGTRRARDVATPSPDPVAAAPALDPPRAAAAYADPAMPDDTLRWPGGWARLGSWRGERDVAYLAVGAQRPPSAEVLDRCLRTLRGRGYSARPHQRARRRPRRCPFVDAGFSVHERLHLLAHDLGDIPPADHETRRGRDEDHAAVLALDRRSFRPFWRLDRDGLEQALDATPATRFRVVETARRARSGTR